MAWGWRATFCTLVAATALVAKRLLSAWWRARLSTYAKSAPSAPSSEITFVRAKGGLCNKLRVVLSYREAAVVDGGHRLVVVWVVNEECPARFAELFEPLDGVDFLDSDDPELDSKLRALGSPHGMKMKRDMRTHPAIAALGDSDSGGADHSSDREQWMSDREATMYLQLTPRHEIRRAVDAAIAGCGSGYAAVHVRRTDHVALWGISTPDSEFFLFADRALGLTKRGSHRGNASSSCSACSESGSSESTASSSTTNRLYLATDNAETQAAFSARYGHSRVCTYAPIDAAPTALRHTNVSDAVIDLYVCASATVFKGTRGSSFSDAIWLLRRAQGSAHASDELHTGRQLRRRRWRQQKAAASGEARAASEAAERFLARSEKPHPSVAAAEEEERDRQETEGSGGAIGFLSRFLNASWWSRAVPTPAPRLHVVVAHYQWRTFESLVDAVHHAIGCEAVHVYDKSASGYEALPVEGSVPTYTVHRVPNVGRESESYLRHIVQHYDDLGEHTLFIQDDAHIHVPRHHVAAFVAQVLAEVSCGGGGRVLQVVHRGRKLYPPRRIDSHDKMHGRLSAACERFGLRMPHVYETHVCAFFVASRACIRRRPKEFYERLLAWHAESESVANRRGASEEQLAPWLCEHLWQLIFFDASA